MPGGIVGNAIGTSGVTDALEAKATSGADERSTAKKCATRHKAATSPLTRLFTRVCEISQILQRGEHLGLGDRNPVPKACSSHPSEGLGKRVFDLSAT